MSDLSVWPLPLNRLSASSLGVFARCAEQFRRRYVLEEREPFSASAIVGNAIHGAAEANFRSKMVTGSDLPVGDVLEAYSASYDAELEEAGGASEVTWTMSRRDTTPGRAKDVGAPVARMYHENVSPTIQPVTAEQWFDMRIEGVPVPISGKIDLYTQTSKLDLKFGAQAPVEPKTEWRMQGLIYLLRDELPFGWHTGKWGTSRSDPVINTPATAPALIMPRTTENLESASSMIRSFATAIVAYYRQFGPDEPWPGTGLQHGWACKLCTFRPTCPYWSGKRKVSLF